MTTHLDWQKNLDELVERDWDAEGIRARLKEIKSRQPGGFQVDWNALLADRQKTLDRVQTLGEDYEYLTHSCAKGSLLALMDEFGLGNWEMVKAMSPFPGFGMTGGICGGVTGSMVALGLFFGGDDAEDYQATGVTMTAAREFIAKFKEKLGTISCPEIQEQVVFGSYMDPRGSQEKFAAFQKAHGYEKCALIPGLGARLAAEVILDSKEG